MDMNLTKYDIFFKVLKTKTISQAAKELGYSQSAISQTIKALEEELETTLFIRQKSGVTLSQGFLAAEIGITGTPSIASIPLISIEP